MFDCNVSISAYGEMGRWSRAKVGLSKHKKLTYLVINMSTKSFKFPIDRLKKIHSSALEFQDPNRTVNFKSNDPYQLKVLMKQCSALITGKLDRKNIVSYEEQKSIKPSPTSVSIVGKTYTKETFKNQSLEKVNLLQVNPLPRAIWDLKNLNTLILNECNLADLPSSIINIAANLKTLNLSKNKITRLEPVVLGRLKNVVHLDLSHNLLRFLPLNIGRLRCLSVLNLSANRIHNLPFTFAALNKLKELHLSGNCITSLNQIFLMKLRKNGMQLTNLDLSGNIYPKYEAKDRPCELPDLFSLAASQVLHFADKINQLYLHLPYDMEDYINIRSEICCTCLRPFLRFKPGEPGQNFYLGQIASSVCGSVGNYNYIKLYKVNCFYCESKLIEIAKP
ncbi:leucine-rich repeat-containing protein 69-like [Panonychus citri]|uniref:leucine-rich repeat-containing protein 69-like n=1 Tax=Panonychus citri TaxID=50023 RepID=UPI0023070CEA|nr:leucine-rich repeat-containing protein 69-like [Panonychus citri]